VLATEGAIDLGRLLLDILIVLAAAKLAAEAAERVRLPAVLGEIVAGVLIGPSAFGLVELGGDRGVSISLLAEIGVLLLLLQVGMEMDLAELGKVGKASVLVAVIGVAAPFALGFGAGLGFGQAADTALFFGAALTATSVGITARVFGDLRALSTTEARIVLGAAVADDVLGLIILTVVVKVVTGGDVSVGLVAGTLGLAVLFLLGTGVVGIVVVPRILDGVHRRASSSATVTVVAFVIALGFAELAAQAKLAFIIGAFMAGMGLGQSRHHERIALDLGAIGNVFIPVFFVQIGINADLEAMVTPSVLGLAMAMTVLAVVGKLVAAVGATGTRADRLLIGLGMVPRGEVGLIFASIGLAAGVLDADQYGALLLVVLLTTVVTPPLLRLRLGRAPATPASEPAVAMPTGGWLAVQAGEIALAAVPPTVETVPVALRVAALAAEARPSNELLDWFGTHHAASLTWDVGDTPALVRLLRTDSPRAWRFLDTTGVLDRALPEVAHAMRRRRADISDLDPIGALRFPVVERLDAQSFELGLPDDDLVLAAFAADVSSDADDGPACVTALATRLVGADGAVRIGAIVADALMLRARCSQPREPEEPEILQLAGHLASPRQARAAHALALALGPLRRWQRENLDEQLASVLEALEHPELTSGAATDLASARRAAAVALLDDERHRDRLRTATTAYLLSHPPDDIARQVRLLEPLPRRGTVRVGIEHVEHVGHVGHIGDGDDLPDRWTIDVASLDTEGLLAHLADVLGSHGLAVDAATIATWPDGGVVDTFVVHGNTPPAAAALADDFEAALGRPLRASAVPALQLEFDNHSLPWHTACTATGPDVAGALLALSTAFALAGADVHSARIATADGVLDDRFALTDRLGRKLDQTAMARIRGLLAGTAAAGRRRRR
jgi:Kef-type K+ transport system membrane component KefB